MLAGDEGEIIGGDIPPYTFTTVELAMTYNQELTYAKAHDASAANLFKHYDPKLKLRRRDQAAPRRLYHLAFSTSHENLLQQSTLLVGEINELGDYASDMGWFLWCRYSTSWPLQVVHRQPLEALLHITAASPNYGGSAVI